MEYNTPLGGETGRTGGSKVGSGRGSVIESVVGSKVRSQIGSKIKSKPGSKSGTKSESKNGSEPQIRKNQKRRNCFCLESIKVSKYVFLNVSLVYKYSNVKLQPPQRPKLRPSFAPVVPPYYCLGTLQGQHFVYRTDITGLLITLLHIIKAV